MTIEDSSFVINYGDGTSDIIKPVSWRKLEDVELLSFEILKVAYDTNFSLASIFKPSNKKFWDNAKKLASILPVAGAEEPGFDPELIDSLDELCRIFISTSTYRKLETGSVWNNNEILEPSEICRIHRLNFIDLLLRAEEQIMTEEESTTTKTEEKGRKGSRTSKTK